MADDLKILLATGVREGFTKKGMPMLGKLKEPKREISWAKLAKNLRRSVTTDDKGSHGYIVGGWFNDTRRLDANLVERQLVILDADYLDPFDLDGIEDAYEGMEMVAHTTWSHSDDAPRVRIVIPLSRPVSKEEYEPIARKLAAKLDINAIDTASYKWNQLMWMPANQKGVTPLSWRTTGKLVNPDKILASYDDWTDWAQWPQRDVDRRATGFARQAKNPYEAPGVIGAFNRVFSIPHAINEFDLPYEPEDGDITGDRWGYTGRSGSCAARVYHNYGDSCFLYSDHDTDPANGNNTAWDLVRIHRFGELDEGFKGKIGDAPSQKAMKDFAMDQEEVVRELAGDEFDDLGDAEVDLGDGETIKAQSLTFDNLEAIMEDFQNDPFQFTRENGKKMMRKLAAANLDQTDEDIILSKMVEVAGMAGWRLTMAAGRKDVSNLKKRMAHGAQASGEIEDIEILLMQRVLDDHFEGGAHIRRFAKQFWTYEGGVWITRSDEWIRNKLQETFVKIRKERPEDAEEIVAAVGESRTSLITSVLWSMFCSHVSGLDESTDPMRMMDRQVRPVINCLNGHIEFNRKGQHRLVPHDPGLFLTGQVPLVYDPKADTSHWDAFCDLMFHESLESDEMQRHLEEVGGYILQPTRDLATFFLMKGEPAAGKSTFGAVMSCMLGRGVANKEMAKFGGTNDHDTAGLVGKLLLLDEDFNKGDLLPAGFIKRVSEAKQLTANPKYKAEFEFICRSVPMVITNDWPPTRDYSGALQRRLVAWDLPAIPLEDQDDDARRELLSIGLPGVFARFVEGFARLIKRGHWDLPDECVTAAQTWERYTDLVKLFATECFVTCEDGWVPRQDTWGWFQQWYRDNVPGGRTPGKKEFLSRMRGNFGMTVKRKGEHGWNNLRFVGTDFD